MNLLSEKQLALILMALSERRADLRDNLAFAMQHGSRPGFGGYSEDIEALSALYDLIKKHGLWLGEKRGVTII